MKKWRTGRQTISKGEVRHRVSNLMSIALVIALAVIATPRVSAQVECLGVCEERFVTCLQNQNPNSLSPSCQDAYEACVDACLGSYASILG